MPETMDEKQTQPQPAPDAGKASKSDVFRTVSRVWVALMGLGVAGTVALLVSQLAFLGGKTISLSSKVPYPSLSGAGLALGLAAGAAAIFFVFKKLGSRLVWNRPGQGRAVRASAFIGIAAMTLFGTYALYMAPSSTSVWWADLLPPSSLFGKTIALKPILFPALAVFTGVTFGVFLLLNQDRWAEFLIETEGEIKKVSWPARKEFLGSAFIVVLVVAVVSLFLHFVDKGLSSVMQYWKVGF